MYDANGDVLSISPAADALPLEAAGGFGVRFGARLIDSIVTMVLGFGGGIVAGVIAAVLAASGAIDDDWGARVQTASFAWNLGWGSLASVLYFATSEAIAGTTIGKLVLGYRVVTTDLAPCTVGGAIIRELAYYIDAFFFGMVAWSSMKDSPRQQRLGDKWAGTLVVQASALPDTGRRSSAMLAVGILIGAVLHTTIIGVSTLLLAL
jgi:uncharacterized RDD family membrane protein YckC